mmetsp:Transcript_41665/g.75039  ORF Transcript_41665/g.75039 Transcript_41665/m.75039 type:complete len:85 (+) Transcript_41665:434-688(+)
MMGSATQGASGDSDAPTYFHLRCKMKPLSYYRHHHEEVPALTANNGENTRDIPFCVWHTYMIVSCPPAVPPLPSFSRVDQRNLN